MKRTLGEELYRMKKGRYPSRLYVIMMKTYFNLIEHADFYSLISICLLQVLLVILVCKQSN